MYGTDERAYNMISPLGCMLIEGWGTAILMFVILALTERRAGVLGPHKQVWQSCRGGGLLRGLLQAACLHCVVVCDVPLSVGTVLYRLHGGYAHFPVCATHTSWLEPCS